MIPEVKPGEALTAAKQNDIIRACNGLQQPSSSYVNTPSGTLFPDAVPSFNNMQGRCVETLFQLKFGLKQVIDERSQDSNHLHDDYTLSSVSYGYSINLGNDFTHLTSTVDLMYHGVDDIFIIGSKAHNGQSNGRLSAVLKCTDHLLDASDKSGFFDLGIYWNSPTDGTPAVQAEKMLLSSDLPTAPSKKAFAIRGMNYPSHEAVSKYYEELSGGHWEVVDSSTADIGYVYNQKLVQLRTGILFPEASDTLVDSEIPQVHLSSVQTRTRTISGDDGADREVEYHQFFHFDSAQSCDFALSTANDFEFVLRDSHTDPEGKIVSYVKLKNALSVLGGDARVDTNETHGAQRSIQKYLSGDNSYLQLYNFDQRHFDDTLMVNLAYGENRYATSIDGSGEYPDPYVEFIVRDHNGTNQVKYNALAVYAPPIYAADVNDLCSVVSAIATHECSCDLASLWSAISALNGELSNYWKVGGTYDDNCYGQSIGDDSGNPQIDLNNGQLLYSEELDPTVDWHNGYLSWNSGELRLDWSGCKAYDTAQEESICWDIRQLKDASGMPTVEWDSKRLNGLSGVAVDWQYHMLIPTGGSPTVEWADCILDDLNSTQSLDWNNKQLIGDWSCPYGDFSIGSGFVLKIGNTTLTEAQLSALLALISPSPSPSPTP